MDAEAKSNIRNSKFFIIDLIKALAAKALR